MSTSLRVVTEWQNRGRHRNEPSPDLYNSHSSSQNLIPPASNELARTGRDLEDWKTSGKLCEHAASQLKRMVAWYTIVESVYLWFPLKIQINSFLFVRDTSSGNPGSMTEQRLMWRTGTSWWSFSHIGKVENCFMSVSAASASMSY